MATETLRPSAAGDVTQLTPAPAVSNYLNVDEVTPDEDTTQVYGNGAASYDLYNLPAHAGTGTINFIKVIARMKYENGFVTPYIRIKTYVTEYSQATGLTSSWADYNYQWNVNPNTSNAWTWAEIDALQIGVVLPYNIRVGRARCTQVYVEVDYTEAAVGTNMQVNVDDVFRPVDEIHVQKDDVFRPAEAYVNKDDVWRT